jgi:hypothetical protein
MRVDTGDVLRTCPEPVLCSADSFSDRLSSLIGVIGLTSFDKLDAFADAVFSAFVVAKINVANIKTNGDYPR